MATQHGVAALQWKRGFLIPKMKPKPKLTPTPKVEKKHHMEEKDKLTATDEDVPHSPEAEEASFYSDSDEEDARVLRMVEKRALVAGEVTCESIAEMRAMVRTELRRKDQSAQWPHSAG